ncbi:hypothetical protein MMC28_009979 [Mycoblastus sanguinarius]|nr:hypothetical protein [Mycoblastus sanguinarius]
MGFWDTLLHGAADIANHVIKNAGSIAEVVKTITEMTGATYFEADDDPNMLHKLFHGFVAADNHLLNLVKEDKDLQAPSDSRIRDGKASLSGPYDLSALWPSPPSQIAPRPPPIVSADINKFLTLSGLPTSLGHGDGTTDIGLSIAQDMFSDSELSSGSSGGLTDKKNFTIKTKEGYEIHGGHHFYKIPLGNPGTDVAWHSVLRLWTVTPHETEANFAAVRKALSIKRAPVKPTAEKSYNSTKVAVKWTGSNHVESLTKTAINNMTQENGLITYQNFSYDGTKITAEFQSPTTIGPAEIASAFSTAISKVIPKTTTNNQLPQMPQVTIENMTTYIV